MDPPQVDAEKLVFVVDDPSEPLRIFRQKNYFANISKTTPENH